MIGRELVDSVSFWSFLLSIDQDLAESTRRKACSCGGRLHCANGSSGVSGGWMAQSKPNSWCDMQLWQETSVSGPPGQVPAAKRVAAKARL